MVYSNKIKTVIHIELTSPSQERFEISNQKKLNQYCKGSVLGVMCIKNSFSVEVGCRGYVAESLPQCLRKLGIGKQRSRKICSEAADAAIRASFWLWILRDRKEWSMSTGFSERSDAMLVESKDKAVHKDTDTENHKEQEKQYKPRGRRKYSSMKKIIQEKSSKKTTKRSNARTTAVR